MNSDTDREQQTRDGLARNVFVVRPGTFGSNPQTAATNRFQLPLTADARVILAEFDGLVQCLQNSGVRVVVGRDTPEPQKPDAVFSNNWVSFHASGEVVVYPLCAPNRRDEVRWELVDELERALECRWPHRIDLSAESENGRFLEGTGSLVLDRTNRCALVARSARNDPQLVREWAERMDYTLLEFDTRGPGGQPVYHTNVLLALGLDFAVWARDWVADADHSRLEQWFEATGRAAIVLDAGEAASFAGNALGLRSRAGDPLWILSGQAERALRPSTRKALESRSHLVPIDLDTIEAVGGGSARCCITEICLPR